MIQGSDPRWLQFLSRRLSWLAVPNIGLILVTLQALGFLCAYSDPMWIPRLALIPEAVLHGELWRLVTFLSIPVSMSPLWIIFTLFFYYSILGSIEEEWGAFKTTFYVLVSVVLTILYSFLFDYPVLSVSDFASTLFLAAAALFPEHEINVYMIFPVKMKFLGYFALAFVLYRFFQGSGLDRGFLLAIYSNYLIFFGPSLVHQFKMWKRRRNYRSNWKR